MPVQRPPLALWGRETEHALANFDVSGQALPIEIIHALAEVKAAAAAVNAAHGMDSDIAAAISTAALAVAGGAHDDQFLIDIFQTGSGTSTNMNVNEVIARLASDALGKPVHPNDHVNASQSSNDVFPTAVTLAAQILLRHTLLASAQQLATSLRGAAAKFADVIKAGRTHMMDAVPMFLSDEFGGYAAQIEEGIERITAALPRLGRVPLGGTAVGNGLNAPDDFGATVAAHLADRHDVPLTIAPNRFAAQAARDGLVEASALLRSLAMAVIKVANDLRLMSSGPSTGLGELRLPELQAGSSIMPGKVNPVMCEMATQVGIQIFGNDAAIAFAGSQGQFELNTYQPMMAANLMSSLRLLSSACRLLASHCIDGIEVDAERCRLFAESTPALATALNEALGYAHVARIVKAAVAGRMPLLEAVAADGALDAGTARALLDARAVARGNRPDGSM